MNRIAECQRCVTYNSNWLFLHNLLCSCCSCRRYEAGTAVVVAKGGAGPAEGCTTGPADFSVFDALRDTIYSEVATLIANNENRPHFLVRCTYTCVYPRESACLCIHVYMYMCTCECVMYMNNHVHSAPQEHEKEKIQSIERTHRTYITSQPYTSHMA